MRRARACRQQVFWQLTDLYKYLQLSCFKNTPSKWIFNSAPRWAAFFQEVFGTGGHINFGTYWRQDCGKRGEMPWWCRCLPSTCASTCSMLALLLRWAYVVGTAGGLNNAEAKLACAELVAALLSCVGSSKGAPKSFDLAICKSWVCRWPRPCDEASMWVKIHIEGGEADLSQLLAASDRLCLCAGCPTPSVRQLCAEFRAVMPA